MHLIISSPAHYIAWAHCRKLLVHWHKDTLCLWKTSHSILFHKARSPSCAVDLSVSKRSSSMKGHSSDIRRKLIKFPLFRSHTNIIVRSIKKGKVVAHAYNFTAYIASVTWINSLIEIIIFSLPETLYSSLNTISYSAESGAISPCIFTFCEEKPTEWNWIFNLPYFQLLRGCCCGVFFRTLSHSIIVGQTAGLKFRDQSIRTVFGENRWCVRLVWPLKSVPLVLTRHWSSQG